MNTVGKCLVWKRDSRDKLDLHFIPFMPRVRAGAFGVAELDSVGFSWAMLILLNLVYSEK